MGGDFNASKSSEESWGRSYRSRLSEMEDFGCFNELLQLVDVPVVGSIHTYINASGTASS